MIASHEDNNSILRIYPPKKSEIYTIRILILLGLSTIGVFLWWFFSEDRIGYPYLFWPLTAALFFKILRTLHEWYHYYHVSVPVKPELKVDFTVDILTTACPGEPTQMILNTLKAMQAIRYPHTSYLCDEGDDPVLKKACQDLGIIHVTRTEKTNAKAGNINNALKQAKGEICIVLDPDHEPVPEFIDRILPYFQDPAIGFVQSVQAYSNRKESLVALGACEQTYHFYGPMMMSMNSYGTAQAIGANCAFRRKALDSIGGHAAGLAEDMHTSMLLHSKGWKSIYIPEILTRGLVPSSLPAYYKQQLKWSRGTFDIFFGTLPKIFGSLTWRQRLHYSTIPLYFFYGLIDFMNILIPVLSLVLAEFPWQVDVVEFFRMTIPILIMTLVIRQYSQRWLLEKHERGFHMVGGLLRIGTWWVFSLGFIYTLLKIKVPYIPTSKDGNPENAWKLCTVNILACMVCIGAIIYGLHIDMNPYTFFMAGMASVNVCILGYVIIVGQQKLLLNIYEGMNNSILKNFIYPTRLLWWHLRHSFYYVIRNSSLMIGLLTIALFFSFIYNDKEEYNYTTSKKANIQSSGEFYAGISFNGTRNKFTEEGLNKGTDGKKQFKIISFIDRWKSTEEDSLTAEFLKKVSASGYMPLITWSLDSTSFLNHQSGLYVSAVVSRISDGYYDDYLYQYAVKIRSVGSPVFIRFAPEYDIKINEQLPSHAEDYITAWKYVVKFFEKEGVSNVAWVWNPSRPEKVKEYFPGKDYVDWIGISCSGFKGAGRSKSNFRQFYEPYKKQLEHLGLRQYPVMLSEWKMSNVSDVSYSAEDMLTGSNKYPEIRSIVLRNDDSTYWGRRSSLQASGRKSSVNSEVLISALTIKESTNTENKDKGGRPVQGKAGSFSLMVDNKPFYIKGVAYSSSHFLVEDDLPLTRSQLKKDFRKIKEMGANTIRRYHTGMYDRNVLNVADEFGLKVMYGFWFDPEIDYLKDTIKLLEYYSEVEKMVIRYRDYPSVLGWTLGNDTYSSLKHSFQKPYLNSVRRSYINFMEKLSKRIHELDPARPVFAILPHTNELPGALYDFHQYAPSIDVMGINSHDKDDLRIVHNLMEKFDNNRPYLISEFSSGGYWNEEILKKENGMLVEQNDLEKANVYFWNWLKYVNFKKGYNLGGVAYSYRDKPEGTATWFGLTDIKGRLKPSYYMLKKIWKDPKATVPMPWVYIEGPTSIVPENAYKYKVVEEYYEDFEYEWYLQTEKKMKYLGKLEEAGQGREVFVTVPEESEESRLYVYVSDDHGNVVTASLPLKLKDD